MKRVIVVTDSSATIPEELARALDIRVVPILLNVNGYSFRDGDGLTHEQVYRLLRESRHPITTSAPSVGDFLHAYVATAEHASGIVSIHPSPHLSGTCQAAATAGQMLDDVPVRVLGCPVPAIGQGLVVLEAARAAAAGAGVEDVAARAEALGQRVHLLATIHSLEYLHRGGRIGGAAALLGSVLKIKPVLCLVDGRVDVFRRPRTQSKAIQAMLDHMSAEVDGQCVHAAVLHADMPKDAEELRAVVASRFDCAELYVVQLTPAMGVHTGPGVLGIVYYAESPSTASTAP